MICGLIRAFIGSRMQSRRTCRVSCSGDRTVRAGGDWGDVEDDPHASKAWGCHRYKKCGQ